MSSCSYYANDLIELIGGSAVPLCGYYAYDLIELCLCLHATKSFTSNGPKWKRNVVFAQLNFDLSHMICESLPIYLMIWG